MDASIPKRVPKVLRNQEFPSGTARRVKRSIFLDRRPFQYELPGISFQRSKIKAKRPANHSFNTRRLNSRPNRRSRRQDWDSQFMQLKHRNSEYLFEKKSIFMNQFRNKKSKTRESNKSGNHYQTWKKNVFLRHHSNKAGKSENEKQKRKSTAKRKISQTRRNTFIGMVRGHQNYKIPILKANQGSKRRSSQKGNERENFMKFWREQFLYVSRFINLKIYTTRNLENEFSIKRKLGSGSSAKVYLFLNRAERKFYAAKIFKKKKFKSAKFVGNFRVTIW